MIIEMTAMVTISITIIKNKIPIRTNHSRIYMYNLSNLLPPIASDKYPSLFPTAVVINEQM